MYLNNTIKSFYIKFVKDDTLKNSKIIINNDFNISLTTINNKEGMLVINFEENSVYREKIKTTHFLDENTKTYKSFLTIIKNIKNLIKNEKIKIPNNIEKTLSLIERLIKINIARMIGSKETDIFFVDEALIKDGLILLLSSTDKIKNRQVFKIDYAEYNVETNKFYLQTIRSFREDTYDKSFNKLLKLEPKIKEIYLEFL